MLEKAPPALVCFAGDVGWYRRPMLSAREVFCGPRCETVVEGGLYRSIKTPPGEFDLAKLVAGLPAEQRPALVVVQVNRSAQTVARNLHAVDALKVLIAGDTHHLQNPISFLLEYVLAERYDVLVSEFDRQHLHYFVESGLPRVHWLPFLSLNPHPQPSSESLDDTVAFVGSVGKYHPYRQSVLDALQANGVPLRVSQAPQMDAARVYAKSLLSLNVSLNGDLNLRTLEVLSAGGFLLTDRLSAQSGADLLFEDGRDLVFFDGKDDLLAKVNHYRQQPADALAIRNRGRALALREFSTLNLTSRFLDLVLDSREEDTLALKHEPRCRRLPGHPLNALLQRVRAYEYVQEEHRKADAIRVVAAPSVSDWLVADLADLPRLSLRALCRDDADVKRRRAGFARAGVAERVDVIRDAAPSALSEPSEILIVGADEAGDLARFGAPGHVLIEQGRERLDVASLGRITETLARRGLRLTDALLPAYGRGA